MEYAFIVGAAWLVGGLVDGKVTDSPAPSAVFGLATLIVTGLLYVGKTYL